MAKDQYFWMYDFLPSLLRSVLLLTGRGGLMEQDKVRSFMDRRKKKRRYQVELSVFKVGGNCEAVAGC